MQETSANSPTGDPSSSAHPGDGPDRLPRILGVFDATMIVVGSIIGSGIFLKVSAVDAALQGFGFLPIIGTWLFVGVITLCGSLALAELGAMFPEAGGPYLYIREAFGRLPAFLWGWTEFWIVRTGSVGALACATVLYANELVTMTPIVQTVLAIGIVVGLSALNLFSTRAGAAVQSLATIAKVVFLAGLIVLPIVYQKIDTANLSPLLAVPSDGNLLQHVFSAFGAAMLAILWAYDGWINLGPVAEDIRDPQRSVPKAMALGLSTVIVVYLGANLSYHLVLPANELAESTAVAASVFGKVFGPAGTTVAAVGVMISTFGATNSNMITGPRIYLAIARDGLIPSRLHRLHHRYRTPANTIIIQAVWTVVLILLFSFRNSDGTDADAGLSESQRHVQGMQYAFGGLTDSVICAGLIFYGMAVAAVYVLRKTRPNAERPYRTWGYPVTPALLLIAYTGVFVNMLAEQLTRTTFVLAFIAAGIIYYRIVAALLRKSLNRQ